MNEGLVCTCIFVFITTTMDFSMILITSRKFPARFLGFINWTVKNVIDTHNYFPKLRILSFALKHNEMHLI